MVFDASVNVEEIMQEISDCGDVFILFAATSYRVANEAYGIVQWLPETDDYVIIGWSWFLDKTYQAFDQLLS